MSVLAFAATSGGGGAPCAEATPAHWKPGSNVLRGDVTGDGRQDSVFVGQRYPVKPFCRRLLFVRTGARTLMKPHVENNLDWTFEQATPAPAALMNLDPSPGAEVLVLLHRSGDGHAFYGLYTVRGGRIVRYRVPSYANELVDGGSVGLPSALMCGRPRSGLLIQSNGGARATGFDVRRDFLHVRGLELVVVKTRRARVKDPRRLPEFRTHGRCLVAWVLQPNLPRNPKEPIAG